MRTMYKNVNEKNILYLNIIAGVLALILIMIDSYRDFSKIEVMMLMMKGYTIFFFLLFIIILLTFIFCVDYLFIKKIKVKECYLYLLVALSGIVISIACLRIFMYMAKFSFGNYKIAETFYDILASDGAALTIYPAVMYILLLCGLYSAYQVFFGKIKKQKMQNQQTVTSTIDEIHIEMSEDKEV